MFALQAIPAGQRILEYRGEVTSWRRASARHRRSGMHGHTFIFGLADGRVIDGSVGGNSARWLNHSCKPNCEAIEDGGGRGGTGFHRDAQRRDAGRRALYRLWTYYR
ncbi:MULTISPECIES: SET domain-containing protein [Paraburkholderia]|uniref:SET domain-containing protein n=1 Tax=Paraburkholderia TaxID=1822464 RepID=UPI0038B6EC98